MQGQALISLYGMQVLDKKTSLNPVCGCRIQEIQENMATARVTTAPPDKTGNVARKVPPAGEPGMLQLCKVIGNPLQTVACKQLLQDLVYIKAHTALTSMTRPATWQEKRHQRVNQGCCNCVTSSGTPCKR